MTSKQTNQSTKDLSNRSVNQLVCEIKFLKSVAALATASCGAMVLSTEETQKQIRRAKKYLKYNTVDSQWKLLLQKSSENDAEPITDENCTASYDSEAE